ncbi:pentatricopeptide repeat-containing protein At2g13600-like [Selaginella moellendorffii]|uniref:pentatricopeptide repeat-containing protein At2g13600-like n=1 Tax=Selaginella moellendorffii TaxID=88036 RepID=UPI000D1D1053|nr:pentatricopeptide repeat-containing protein At2g13600-like [Selaginella moellendorffii]|eukprot:XP_024527520.1 pentatricopeptide repeat-containing protein At2g13600-like [Selaginella moellendorffii]
MVELGSMALEELERSNVISWARAPPRTATRPGGALLWGREELQRALDRVEQLGGIHHISLSVFAALLRQCGNVRALNEGRRVHASLAMVAADSSSAFWANLLIQMYGKCGSSEDARDVFDKLGNLRNSYSWTILLTAYTQTGHLLEANFVYERMPCFNVVAWTILITANAKHGNVIDAKKIFDAMHERNLVSWNALLTAYAQKGYRKEAVRMFSKLDQEGERPNEITLTSVLEACSDPRTIYLGRTLHSIVSGDEELSKSVVVSTALVNMYAQCGRSIEARSVFDTMATRNSVTWTSMISAYARNGQSSQALLMLELMDVEGIEASDATFVCAIHACANLRDLSIALVVHDAMKTSGSSHLHDLKVENAIVDMYSKCGSLDLTQEMFDAMGDRNVISWSALIAAYAQSDRSIYDAHHAIRLFLQMDLEGMDPNEVTSVAALDACSKLASVELGKTIHANIIVHDVVVATALVNMYAKCGTLHEACKVFLSFPQQEHDTILCNAMLTAFVHNGCEKLAIETFRSNLELQGIRPTSVTFIAVLLACARAGLVGDGWSYFVSLKCDYGIIPSVFHYECMLDLLGRAGLVCDAEELTNNMPMVPDSTAWLSVLSSACRSDPNVADRVFQNVDLDDPVAYVLLANTWRNTSGNLED